MTRKTILLLFTIMPICLALACAARNVTATHGAAVSVQTPVDLSVMETPALPPPTKPTVPDETSSPSPVSAADPFADLAPTIRMRFEELVGDNGDYDIPKGYPAADTYRAVVDIHHQVVLIYKQDAEGNYTVPVRYMLCSTGIGDSTPPGTYRIKRYRVRFGFFRNDKTYGQYWTLIEGRIYFHSILYSERDAAAYIGETYDQLGSRASHGCVRLTVPDARFIYYNFGYGTEVEIRQGDPADALTASIRDKLLLAKQPSQRPYLIPGGIPSSDNWTIADTPHDLPYEEGSQRKNY